MSNTLLRQLIGATERPEARALCEQVQFEEGIRSNSPSDIEVVWDIERTISHVDYV